ncbi:MAG: hypothetical protein PGN29_19530 [Gordonia paraffinivorans]
MTAPAELFDHPWRRIGGVLEVDVHRGPYASVTVELPMSSTDTAAATVYVGNDDTILVTTVDGLRAYAADLVEAADSADMWRARLARP